MSRSARALALVVLAALLPLVLGGRCGGGDGSGGSATVINVAPVDDRCAALDVEGFPPGFGFIPQAGGGTPRRALAATASRSNLLLFDIESVPFRLSPGGTSSYELPGDADGDGFDEFFKSIDDVVAVSDSLALVPVSGDASSVLFIDPGVVGPRFVEVATPAAFDPADFAGFPGLPAPGSSRVQTGVTTVACIAAGPDALDSRGDRVADALPPFFRCNGPGSFPASFVAGAAIVGSRLFAVTSNLGLDPGTPDTQFLPGSVVVFELDDPDDPTLLSPSLAGPAGRPYVITTAFNPTELTPFTTPGGRRLLLVTHTGAIGIRADDPSTDPIESGAIPITEGAIDVLDADALEIIATYPLVEANPSLRGLGLDPSGRIALFGDVGKRQVYGIDLAPLDGLPPAGSTGLPVDLSSAVIFDGLNPLVVPVLRGGAPPESCPGQIEGVAINQAGTRAYALETCDGTVAGFDLDLSGDPSLAELRGRVTLTSLSIATAPLRPDTIGEARSPGSIAVRPGRPGIDYAGPDVFFTVGDPNGSLCGVRIDAP